MADAKEKILQELLRKPGNDTCADCSSPYPEWASYNIGIFICTRCAGIHRALGAHISKVKHLKLDRWEDSQVKHMEEVGNAAAQLKYEERVPVFYRKPERNCPHILIEQWIRAKYMRKEFNSQSTLPYISGYMSGFLMKKGKDDSKYQPRKFILSESEDTLKYHIKEKKDPKTVLRISEINIALAPEKIGHNNSMQLSFMREDTTRHIYLYHNDAEVLINWYMAIRCAKLHRLQIAYPSANESELLQHLTHDFLKEGWLWKTGPKQSDAFKKRWFTLDQRKLMYHDDIFDAHPKGEIFIGYMLHGYSVRIGSGDGVHEQGFPFTLQTPERTYNLSSESEAERDDWIFKLSVVIEKPLSSRDHSFAAKFIRKRGVTSNSSLFNNK